MAFSKFLDPKCDLTFKRIFGAEKNKNILIHFLNDILGFSGENAIQEVEFLSTIMDPDIASDKQSIVDILCKDSHENKYIVEMQVARDKGFEKRAQLYAARAYSRQSGSYVDLKKIFFIAISNFILFPKDVGYISTHNIRDMETNGHYLKDFQFVFVELPKFSKKKVDELANTVECWCYFFRYAEETTEEDLKKIAKHEPIMELAYNEVNKCSWDEKDLVAYEEGIMEIYKKEAILAQRLDDAKAEGKAEGKIEGKIEVAKNLLKTGISIEVIVKSTDLTADEIKQLIED
jgi:predicted transposase/invertase (TIGR01784 family)